MLLIYLISSFIFSIFLFSLEHFVLKASVTNSLIKTICFLLLSIALSFLINYLMNPQNNYIPPKNSDNSDGNENSLNQFFNKGLPPELLNKIKKVSDKSSQDFKKQKSNISNFMGNLFDFST